MGKYRRYKNRIEMFLASERGKRALNFCYSWGASIVIIGALFKLLHLPYGNQILFVAMTVEALVFFISAFEHPSSEYHWEEVFPVLKSKNPMDRPDFAKQGEEPQVAGMAPGVHINTGGTGTPGIDLDKLGLNLKEEDSKKLSESIQKLNGAAEQIGKMAELTEATQKYLEQLSTMSDNMARFSTVTGELTNVSGTLLDSYKSITDNSDDLTQNSQNYVQQMSQLQQHVAQLNAIYEAQAKNIAAQMEAVEHITASVGRIREMYDGTVGESAIVRSETEKMTRQLAELNQVYARLLQAMTVNMGYHPQGGYPQQPTYQQPYQQPYGYPQQPQAPYNPPMK